MKNIARLAVVLLACIGLVPLAFFAGLIAVGLVLGLSPELRSDLQEIVTVVDASEPVPVTTLGTISGYVLDAEGEPVEGARVVFGCSGETWSGRDGFFNLVVTDQSGPGDPFEDRFETLVLAAFAPGHMPAAIEGFGKRFQRPLLRSNVVLQFEGPERVIRGRVVDADGRPVRGYLIEPVEALHLDPYCTSLVEIPAYSDTVRSDRRGRFVLRGLRSRPYHLRAVDPKTLLAVEAGPYGEGTVEVELRLPEDPWRTVEGVVVSRATGERLSGVKVGVRREPSGMVESWGTAREHTTTDVNGRFRLERVPLEGVRLAALDSSIKHNAVVPAGKDQTRLEVTRLMRFRTRTSGDRVRMRALDADGEPLSVAYVRPGGGRSYYGLAPVIDDGVYEVEETAAELALYDDQGDEFEDEVLRVDLPLIWQMTTTVELP